MTNESNKPTVEQTKQRSKMSPWIIVLIIIGIFLVVAAMVFISCNSEKPASSEPLPTPIAQDDSWKKVREEGVLRVATSADYPPFSYYNDDYKIDGFDPALIKEIAEILGVEAEITDYAFDGLESVLHAGQADVVIAALSVSPEREAVVDFSSVYYVGEDGILAWIDSPIDPITNPEQMAGMRIGVQRVSIYQDWVQTNLVDTGIISQDELFVYSKPEHAVDDLRLRRLDLVIMDLQPATAALALGDLDLIGQGLNQQRLAIAIPKGANTLQAVINRALIILQNEGKVNELAGLYLGLRPEDVIPPPTPEPTQEPTPEPSPDACIDAMEIEKDLNFDDKDLTKFPSIDPKEAFQKGIRIKNTGSCTWTNTYFIKYVHGNTSGARMQGVPTSIKGEVKPGQTYDMYINLVAPKEAGKYVGYWQMSNNDNEAFGQTISVAVKVRSNKPVEPTITLTPSATVTPTLEPTEPGPTATATPEPTATGVPSEPTPTLEPGSDLRDSPWILSGYLVDSEDEELTEPLQGVLVNLLFDGIDSFNGNSGCNSYNGRYITNGKQIIFSGFIITQSICDQPEGIMNQETLFLSLLESAEEYRLNDNDQLELILFIMNENNELEEKIILVLDGLVPEPY